MAGERLLSRNFGGNVSQYLRLCVVITSAMTIRLKDFWLKPIPHPQIMITTKVYLKFQVKPVRKRDSTRTLIIRAQSQNAVKLRFVIGL